MADINSVSLETQKTKASPTPSALNRCRTVLHSEISVPNERLNSIRCFFRRVLQQSNISGAFFQNFMPKHNESTLYQSSLRSNEQRMQQPTEIIFSVFRKLTLNRMALRYCKINSARGKKNTQSLYALFDRKLCTKQCGYPEKTRDFS